MTTLRVMTYNVHHGAGMDERIDLERIAKIIRNAKPDLVAVQEIDRKTDRVQGVDQMAQLADLTGMNAEFSRSIDYMGGEYGNVILTPHEILETRSIALPGYELRSAIRAEIDVPGVGQVSFICVHLTLIRDRQWDSVPLLNELADAAPDGNLVVMAGDFNTNPESATIAKLLGSWTQGGRGETLKTYPSHDPIEQIDYVFGRGVRFEHVTVLDEPLASDHRPVLATAMLP